MTDNPRNALAVLAVCFLVVGCAANDNAPDPTHYWDNPQATTGKQYEADNQACQTAANAQSGEVFSPQDQSFSAYRDCMISHGYVLRTY